MNITPGLLSRITKRLHQPDGYQIKFITIALHGKGVVVNYSLTSKRGIEYRCVGMLPDKISSFGLRPTFDMIV